MEQKIRHIVKRTVSSIVSAPSILYPLLKDEAIGGKLIMAFALAAVIVVNSPLKEAYDTFWHLHLSIGLGELSLSLDLREWVNEGLMAFFFLVVGLEIKRELVNGELRDIKKAILPISAAIGGMIIPAVIYLAINLNSSAIQGWGIPVATDIAFAVAVLALLGNRVPITLKLFLLALAIVDDIGAILVIALFYADIINYAFLAVTAGLVISTWMLRKWLANKLAVVFVLGIALWICAHFTGIHASITGVLMGLLAPVPNSPEEPSQSKRIEEFFLPITTFFVLPVFAFANAGVVLSSSVLHYQDAKPIMAGIVAGLVLGKLIGISGAAWLMVRLGLAKLPSGVGWMHIVGVSIIAGIGFTMSIFITELAFDHETQMEVAKISIFIASGFAALLGSLFLLKAKAIKQIIDEGIH